MFVSEFDLTKIVLIVVSSLTSAAFLTILFGFLIQRHLKKLRLRVRANNVIEMNTINNRRFDGQNDDADISREMTDDEDRHRLCDEHVYEEVNFESLYANIHDNNLNIVYHNVFYDGFMF